MARVHLTVQERKDVWRAVARAISRAMLPIGQSYADADRCPSCYVRAEMLAVLEALLSDVRLLVEFAPKGTRAKVGQDLIELITKGAVVIVNETLKRSGGADLNTKEDGHGEDAEEADEEDA